MAKHAKVLYDGLLAALLSETDDGYVLEYDSDYLEQPNSKSISLTLPKQKAVYTSKTLFAFFDGEVHNILSLVLRHFQIISTISSSKPFEQSGI